MRVLQRLASYGLIVSILLPASYPPVLAESSVPIVAPPIAASVQPPMAAQNIPVQSPPRVQPNAPQDVPSTVVASGATDYALAGVKLLLAHRAEPPCSGETGWIKHRQLRRPITLWTLSAGSPAVAA